MFECDDDVSAATEEEAEPMGHAEAEALLAAGAFAKHADAPRRKSYLLYASTAAAESEPFETVAYLADPQIGFSGNATADTLRFRMAAHSVASAASAVIAGDLVNSWNDAAEIDLFHTVWPSTFGQATYLVPGNHDVNSELKNASEVLRQLQHFRVAFNTSDYGYFDTHFGRFVLLNTEMLILPHLGLSRTTDPRILGPANAQWRSLEASLRTAQPTDKHLFLVGHHPPFVHHEDEPHQYFNMPLEPRRRLLALARRFGVRHMLCGHTHTTRAVSTADGIQVLTTGGTSRVFDANGCGFQTVRLSASAVSIAYTELPGGGGLGCAKPKRGELQAEYGLGV